MKKEWKVFLSAVMYLSRLPVPRTMDHSPEYLQRSPKYFPLIGWITGAIAAITYVLFSRLISSDAGILASMIAGILTTGALHEDGFADVCDGFGGGWTKEKILLIMKDSRIGVFGAIGLICILGSKFLLLREMPSFAPALAHPLTITPGSAGSPHFPVAPGAAPSWIAQAFSSVPALRLFYNARYMIFGLLAAHSLSRLMPVLVIQYSGYVSDPDQSKAKPLTSRKLSTGELVLAILLGLAPFALLPVQFLWILVPVAYAVWELNRYFRKWIGGYTGDCLGAVQQVTELLFYLGFVIVWRFL